MRLISAPKDAASSSSDGDLLLHGYDGHVRGLTIWIHPKKAIPSLFRITSSSPITRLSGLIFRQSTNPTSSCPPNICLRRPVTCLRCRHPRLALCGKKTFIAGRPHDQGKACYILKCVLAMMRISRTTDGNPHCGASAHRSRRQFLKSTRPDPLPSGNQCNATDAFPLSFPSGSAMAVALTGRGLSRASR